MTATLDEFDQYIHHAISLYTDREEAEMLKNEIEILKEENNNIKHDMSEKEVLINGLTGKLHQERAKQIWKTEARQTRKYQSRQNVSLETRKRSEKLSRKRNITQSSNNSI